MRTPGHDFELATGFLRAEGVLARPTTSHRVAYCTDVDAAGRAGVQRRHRRARRRPLRRDPGGRYAGLSAASSACGVCGTESIDDVLAPVRGRHSRAPRRAVALADLGRPRRAARPCPRGCGRRSGLRLDRAACTPPASSTSTATPLVVREDIGRHNAVDKVVGARLLARPARPPTVLVVSGRIGFEIVQKAVAAGVGVLAAVGAPSSLAVDAGRAGRAVHGRVRHAASGSSSTARRSASACEVRHCRRPRLALHACASSTPPTGTWGGPSTGWGCSAPRPRTSTTCCRWSRRERVDLVVVSGDVYDRALPPVDAVELADDDLRPAGRLAGPGRRDQRQPRLPHQARLQRPAGRRRRGAPAHPLAGRRHPRAASTTRTARSRSTACPTSSPTRCAARGRWRPAATRPRSPRRCAGCTPTWTRPGTRSVVMAHAFVAGIARGRPVAGQRQRARHLRGRPPDRPDEPVRRRRLRRARPPARPRHLTDSVRYSGSPLAYSFSEAAHTKGSWLVELGPAGLRAGRLRPGTGPPRGCASVRGRLERPARRPEPAPTPRTLAAGDPDRPPPAAHAMERLRARFPHTLMLAFEPEGAAAAARGPVAAPRRRPLRPRRRPGLRRRGARPRGHHRGGAAAAAGLRLLPDRRRP